MVSGPTRPAVRDTALTASFVVVLAISMLAGCGGVSVHVGAGDTISTKHYREVWARDWKVVNDASSPWNPSGSNPGVCNKGGDQFGCYQTDQSVIAGLKNLIADLRNEPTPVSYDAANRALLAALADEIHALQARDLGLKPPGNEASFEQGISELKTTVPALAAAYGKFPANDRPLPALFGPHRYFG